MRKLILILTAAVLSVPAAAIGRSAAVPADNPAKQCSAERAAMGAAAFKLTYGTNGNRSNAFGKCVAKLAQQDRQDRANAAAQCESERAADPAAFATKYGTGRKHANAFGRCVSATAKATEAKQEQATENAAKACATERQADPAAFKAKYGTNANKSNAFGKCVSGKVKHESQ
ncbi:MAG TPA: hypothetical protein VF002_04340 [Gaiellaceae bacterium]